MRKSFKKKERKKERKKSKNWCIPNKVCEGDIDEEIRWRIRSEDEGLLFTPRTIKHELTEERKKERKKDHLEEEKKRTHKEREWKISQSRDREERKKATREAHYHNS